MRLSQNDIQTLLSLWKFKALSTAALSRLTYSSTSLEYCYRRLLSLERAKLIQSVVVTLKGDCFVWTLQKKGFEAVKSEFNLQTDDGFRSENLKHDVLASAFQIGDLISFHGLNNVIFSEQELRRLETHSYPNWVPKDNRRRPDGYWNFETLDGFSTVALEVELSQKSMEDYDSLAGFYDQTVEIQNVVWVVLNTSLARAIHKRISKMTSYREPCHSYILLTDFVKQGWQSKFFDGKFVGKSFRDQYIQPISGPYPVADWKTLIDFRKYPVNSNSSNKSQTGSLFH